MNGGMILPDCGSAAEASVFIFYRIVYFEKQERLQVTEYGFICIGFGQYTDLFL